MREACRAAKKSQAGLDERRFIMATFLSYENDIGRSGGLTPHFAEGLNRGCVCRPLDPDRLMPRAGGGIRSRRSFRRVHRTVGARRD